MASQASNPETLENFDLFIFLPTEIQWMIWELTLPGTMLRVGGARFPVIEIPQPPEEHLYGNTPDLQDVPIYSPSIVALKVCYQSRMVALENLVPLYRSLTSHNRIICSYISMHDIVDVGILTFLEEWRAMKDETYGPVGRLARRGRTLGSRGWSADAFETKQAKFLYDMASHRLSAVIWLKATTNVDAEEYTLQDTFVIRSSSLEEWVFGSRITIGRVPRVLRSFELDPARWTAYNCATLIGGTRYNRQYNIAGLCSRPEEILGSWVWLLHRLAYPPHSPLMLQLLPPRRNVTILKIFVIIMDGGNCPSCRRPILSRIRECYPELPFDQVDLLFRIERSGVPRGYNNPLRLVHMR
ncbi:hypothetical protein F4813DRAFT_258718 [Daldinia decipiens]|uniref:uncharacterized protein n=1 Tax=Daldinia decipiens TaxID=326647 RepID=UPI0020C535A5|nr:uncharacterized protein F4813DRAFT_258718 [Daldinia decipiens]KAI1653324.1 hypothetical protein F4813DRAFT_258718 [Daldinia decipiens]